jgi:hypothetical protein
MVTKLLSRTLHGASEQQTVVHRKRTGNRPVIVGIVLLSRVESDEYMKIGQWVSSSTARVRPKTDKQPLPAAAYILTNGRPLLNFDWAVTAAT